MTRLACLITTASSLLISTLASAQGIELQMRVRNDSAAVVAGARVCGDLPIAVNAQSWRWEVSSTSGLERGEAGYCMALPEFGPYQSQVVRLNWSPVTVAKEAGASAPAYPVEEFPSAELQALADSFSRYPQAERAQHIYQWMIDNVAFSGIRRGVDGAEHALSQRQGDCTEHMLLAAELLSRNGISVRRALGVAIPEDQNRISAGDLHNWVEYLDNREWRIFDSSRRIFENPAGRRYLALLYYENSQQLSAVPLTTDAQGLKLYLE
ncbi:transglutaminase-like domain-containing protein [Pseudomonas sp. J452]|uniref:transglutaminase-like domain-containing protein n=1 Tax=Pseudomonas sp. J452 TaxID=2898441 RepID=UPI0021AE1D97|nr:transglutaminase-like domain-containing protein [Pseudomonas sp. J452]UUY07321.1 transglutaminase-like domain-containing protein [Pseudomonas sp. J452]